MIFIGADIHSWSCSAIQYLGWEVGGDKYRRNGGNGGCTSMCERARHDGKEVMTPL